MPGSINTMSYDDVKRTVVSEQSSFADFAGNGTSTYIGVMRNPPTGWEQTLDENIEALGPSETLLSAFLRTRAMYRRDKGLSGEDAHDRAFEAIYYGEQFREQFQSEETRPELVQLAGRMLQGEDLVLVCYCPAGRSCHADLLQDELARRVEMLEYRDPERTSQTTLE